MEVLRPYLLHITLALVAIVFFQFIVLMGVQNRVAKISRMLRSLFAGPEGTDLEEMLRRCLAVSEAAQEKGEELEVRLRDLSLEMRGCIQHFGLVRYDAYGDVSGQQSFSLVILDADKNGAIISGLYSRSDSRCYGKAVVGGTPEQSLTGEEQSAFDLALSNSVSVSVDSSVGSNNRVRLLRR